MRLEKPGEVERPKFWVFTWHIFWGACPTPAGGHGGSDEYQDKKNIIQFKKLIDLCIFFNYK